MTRASLSAIGLAVATVVCVAPAQAQNTTSAVGGRVLDAAGAPVARASISVTHVESGQTVTTTSDAQGRWAARGLRPGGPYTITVREGSRSDSRADVFLTLAETTTLDTVLGAAAPQAVTVTGALQNQRFSRDAMGASSDISSVMLAAQASINRNLQDYARNDPRLAQTDKDRGEISALGQNSRFNRISVDGVSINDRFGLESNNLPTAKQPISIDAIQTVQVNISNIDVTQRGYTGASINAVTKSGTNELHGSVYTLYRDQDMAGKRWNASDDSYYKAPAFKETTTGLTLGGPIVKDKLFFFAAYEEMKSSRTSPDYGPVGSSRTNVNITQAAIDRLVGIGRDRWGLDLGSTEIPSGTNLSVKDALIKLDWNIADDHRASLRWSRTQQVEPFFPNFGSRALSLSSHWYDQNKTVESVVGQWFADWSPTFSTELKLSQAKYDNVHRNNSRLPMMMFDFMGPGERDLERTLYAGTERSRHFNELKTDALDAYLGATWTRGAHELKFGLDFSSTDVDNAFLQDANGQYKFQCAPGTYSFGTITNCATADPQLQLAAIAENFANGRPAAYQAQLPLPGKAQADGIARWQLRNTGLFLQDTWRVDPRLTLTLGARVDQTGMPDVPLANPKAQAAMVAGVPATNARQSGGFGLDNTHTLDGKVLFQPRVGFNWNFGSKDERRQLRGGLGLFQGEAASVWLSNPYSNTGMAMAFYGCGPSNELISGSNRDACAAGIFSPDPAAQQAIGSNPASSVDFLGSDLRQPSVWKANLALDAQLPWWGLTAGAEWVHTKVNDGIFYRHLNLGAATRTGPDGREMFYNAAGYDPRCWTVGGAVVGSAQFGSTGCPAAASSRALSNRSFANVLVAERTGMGGGDALTLSLSQQPTRDFGWGVAYTRTSATEVSPLTSSVSNSNFNARSIFNPNEEVAATSASLVRDRFSANANWSRAFFGSYRTTVGAFYEGRKGRPYSWTYYNDLNGDGLAGNDLMYIPSAPGSGEVTFAGGAAEEAKFWEIVNADPALSAAKGGVVKRNSAYAPWVNTIDLRIAQEVPGFMAGHKGVVSLDILNFGNLLNKKWGRTNEVGFQSAGGMARSFVNYKGLDANGRYVYSLSTLEDLVTKQARGESQWALQVTLRYAF